MLPDREQITLPPDGRPLAEQPKWRQDFPIDWPQDHYVARRDFTKFMVLTSFAFVVGQFWIVLQNFLRRRRGQSRRSGKSLNSTNCRSANRWSSLIPKSMTSVCWCARAKTTSSRSARNARTLPAPSCRSRRRSVSCAPVTTARSILRPASPWPGRREGRCRASCSKFATARYMR